MSGGSVLLGGPWLVLMKYLVESTGTINNTKKNVQPQIVNPTPLASC